MGSSPAMDAYLERHNMLHGARFAHWLYGAIEDSLPGEQYRRMTVALGVMEMAHRRTNPATENPDMDRIFHESAAVFVRIL